MTQTHATEVQKTLPTAAVLFEQSYLLRERDTSEQVHICRQSKRVCWFPGHICSGAFQEDELQPQKGRGKPTFLSLTGTFDFPSGTYLTNISIVQCASHYSKYLTIINPLDHNNNFITATRKQGHKFGNLPQITQMVSGRARYPNQVLSAESKSSGLAVWPLILFLLCKNSNPPTFPPTCFIRSLSRFDIPSRVHKLSVVVP